MVRPVDVIAEVTTETLHAFADAWNRHDVDALMSFMTDDCVFESSAGLDKIALKNSYRKNRPALGISNR
jgi:ketosteroid isomerase-like protein